MDDEHPIITGHFDKEAWEREFTNYLTTMREKSECQIPLYAVNFSWILNDLVGSESVSHYTTSARP